MPTKIHNKPKYVVTSSLKNPEENRLCCLFYILF